MNQSQLTLRYAKAIFDLALEKKVLDTVYADMLFIEKVCHDNKDFRNMLHNPVIHVDKKQKVMTALFGSRFSELTLGFIHVIARKRREKYIDGIAHAFVELYKAHKGIKTAYVSSAVPVAETDKQAMIEILKDISGKKIELIESINPDLIGGFVVNMDNLQVDQSLRSKIKQLKKDFEKNLYIKGF